MSLLLKTRLNAESIDFALDGGDRRGFDRRGANSDAAGRARWRARAWRTRGPAPVPKKHLLVIGMTRGYHHGSTSNAVATFWKLGKEAGVWDTEIKTDMEWVTKKQPSSEAHSLDWFDAVAFVNTTGNWKLDDEQKHNATGGRGGPAMPLFQPVSQSFRYDGGPSDHAHVRNFLDCVKSRQDPVVNIDTGFYSTLPTLMGVLAVRNGRTYTWDGQKAQAV